VLVVGICDDDKIWLEASKEIIIKFAQKTKIELQIQCFSNETQLLGYSGTPLDALFLDIELGNNENGIHLAKRLNTHWNDCKIIYMTNYLYYATEVYNTEHIWFILKSQFEKKIKDVFNRILHDKGKQQEKIVLKTIGKQMMSVAPADIYYFEREKRTTRVITTWGEYQVWDKLDDIMKQLPELDFSRCHNSFIVHFRYVQELQRDGYLLYNKDFVQISRGYNSKTKEDFLKWSILYM
jgi:DNA-binding LytR/AlgR family response regulator